MVREIRGHVKELSAYVREFDQLLSLRTVEALRCDPVSAVLTIGSLYPPEAQVAAATAGFIEELTPLEAVLCFQVLSALSFERDNGRLSLMFSPSKRDRYEQHKRLVAAAERSHAELVHGASVSRFAERFAKVAEVR